MKQPVYRPGNHWKLNWCFWKSKDHWDCTSQRKHKRPEIRERREERSRVTGGRTAGQSGKARQCGRYLRLISGQDTCIYLYLPPNNPEFKRCSCSKLEHWGDSCARMQLCCYFSIIVHSGCNQDFVLLVNASFGGRLEHPSATHRLQV